MKIIMMLRRVRTPITPIEKTIALSTRLMSGFDHFPVDLSSTLAQVFLGQNDRPHHCHQKQHRSDFKGKQILCKDRCAH